VDTFTYRAHTYHPKIISFDLQTFLSEEPSEGETEGMDVPVLVY
jgi:hypothetical protein